MILARLHELPEAPWSDLRGKPLDSRDLSKRLGKYEITSWQHRVDGGSCAVTSPATWPTPGVGTSHPLLMAVM